MKKYIITKTLPDGKKLYYDNTILPIFHCMRNQAEVFRGKKRAQEAKAYVEKYASGSELDGKIEIEEIKED